jgi:hypothetical protein
VEIKGGKNNSNIRQRFLADAVTLGFSGAADSEVMVLFLIYLYLLILSTTSSCVDDSPT